MDQSGNLVRDHASRDHARLERTLITSRKAFLGFLMKRLGNRPDAEDVLHEGHFVFVNLFHSFVVRRRGLGGAR